MSNLQKSDALKLQQKEISPAKSHLLVKLKCQVCNQIPSQDLVNRCLHGHIICVECDLSNLNCKCQLGSIKKIANPLFSIVGSNINMMDCPYRKRGCNWMVSDLSEIEQHCKECRYRPIQCLGMELGLWVCHWTGLHQDFAVHIKERHRNNGEFLSNGQVMTANFVMNKTLTKFCVIDAFNLKFVVLFKYQADNPNCVFLVYLHGRKSDANKFIINYNLKNNWHALKFTGPCYSDSDNIRAIINEYRCLVLPKKVVEQFVIKDSIRFRFDIKRKDEVVAKTSEAPLVENNVKLSAPKSILKSCKSESNLFHPLRTVAPKSAQLGAQRKILQNQPDLVTSAKSIQRNLSLTKAMSGSQVRLNFKPKLTSYRSETNLAFQSRQPQLKTETKVENPIKKPIPKIRVINTYVKLFLTDLNPFRNKHLVLGNYFDSVRINKQNRYLLK